MKKKLVLSILVLLMGSTLFITENKKINQEIAIEDLENNKSMAIYIKDDNGNYNKTSNIPTSGYTLNTIKSVCTNNARPSWNIKTNSLKISNLTSNNTGCYLYFDKSTTKDVILANSKKGTNCPVDGMVSAIEESNEGICETEDDWGTSYYYRGAVDDNWVQFAGFYWRIIRINGDGSIRMIYNGPTTDQTGETTQIGKKAYNSSYNDNAYVGFMYGTAGSTTYEATHANTNNSTILGTTTDETTLLGWYKANIVDTEYDKYVSKEAGFCNDRNVYTGSSFSGYTTLGYGTNATVYESLARLAEHPEAGIMSWKITQEPTLKCPQITNDLFTTSGSSKGNKKLQYPVGLITADEVIYAGGKGATKNSSYYLYTNQYYWTMSPYNFNDSNAYMFVMWSNGSFENSYLLSSRYGIRPVINISPDVKLVGDGTTSNPYQIEGVE